MTSIEVHPWNNHTDGSWNKIQNLHAAVFNFLIYFLSCVDKCSGSAYAAPMMMAKSANNTVNFILDQWTILVLTPIASVANSTEQYDFKYETQVFLYTKIDRDWIKANCSTSYLLKSMAFRRKKLFLLNFYDFSFITK